MYCFKFVHINKYHFDLFRVTNGFNFNDVIYKKRDTFMAFANDKITEINTNTSKNITLLNEEEMDRMINHYKEKSNNRFILYESDLELIAIVIHKFCDD